MSTTSTVPSPFFDSERTSVHPKSLSPIDGMSALVHDLKSPLAALTMNLEYALAELPKGDACAETREALVDCRTAGTGLTAMIMNALDIVHGEAGVLTIHVSVVNVGTMLCNVVRVASRDPRAKNVAVRAEGFDGDFQLDAALTTRVLECLLDAALGLVRGATALTLVARLGDDGLELRVPIFGAKLTVRDRAQAFRRGARLSVPGLDRGRSFDFCRVVVEAQGGAIGIALGDDGVSFFRIVLSSQR